MFLWGYCPWMKHWCPAEQDEHTNTHLNCGLGLDGGLGKEGINIWEDPMHKPSLPLLI